LGVDLKKTETIVVLLVVLTFVVISSEMSIVKADSTIYIYIRDDGTVSGPIQRDGDSYTLTGDGIE